MRNHKRDRWGVRAVAAAALLAAMAIGAAGGLSAPVGEARKQTPAERMWNYINPFGYSMSLEPVDLSLAGHRFRIPKAYMTKREHWKGGAVTSIGLEAVLPDMKPYGEDTKHLFKSDEEIARNPGLGELVTIEIDTIEEPSPFRVRDERYLEADFPARCAPWRYGFVRCPRLDSSGFRHAKIYVKQARPRPYIFRCDGDRIAGGSCGGFFPLAEGIELRFNLHRPKLAVAEDVVAGVYRLICGFYRGRAGKTVAYDRCKDKLYH